MFENQMSDLSLPFLIDSSPQYLCLVFSKNFFIKNGVQLNITYKFFCHPMCNILFKLLASSDFAIILYGNRWKRAIYKRCNLLTTTCILYFVKNTERGMHWKKSCKYGKWDLVLTKYMTLNVVGIGSKETIFYWRLLSQMAWKGKFEKFLQNVLWGACSNASGVPQTRSSSLYVGLYQSQNLKS